MLQQDVPKDYVIATGVQKTVREAVTLACKTLDIEIEWQGEGVDEVGLVVAAESNKLKSGQVIVSVDPRYYRPTEVDSLLGDATLAKDDLGWEPKVTFEELITEMTLSDFELAKRDALINDAGYKSYSYNE